MTAPHIEGPLVLPKGKSDSLTPAARQWVSVLLPASVLRRCPRSSLLLGCQMLGGFDTPATTEGDGTSQRRLPNSSTVSQRQRETLSQAHQFPSLLRQLACAGPAQGLGGDWCEHELPDIPPDRLPLQSVWKRQRHFQWHPGESQCPASAKIHN
ncbi:hypothetical protein P7K49_034700 [Saguinus oedipus]|uniref:Uncharacterized protein n=1 Tax=Saguinus oedipus TaxID=9490 RepID=A0ABQ9TWK9_SAGOE|nr:hypothetical protein P7K49_034700 [Saguinus oedipus]